jgi:hypothetical protein
MAVQTQNETIDSAPSLLAILRAARKIGDAWLEKQAREQLRDRHGIEVRFHDVKREVTDASQR